MQCRLLHLIFWSFTKLSSVSLLSLYLHLLSALMQIFFFITLCCFHYANTTLVAGFMSSPPPFETGNRIEKSHLALLGLALMRNWFLEISSITNRQDNYHVLQRSPGDSQFYPEAKERLTFRFSPAE